MIEVLPVTLLSVDRKRRCDLGLSRREAEESREIET